ncbi:2-amino-4-hydroxy-6-hydroxymethyldihydropteridine diphosphokinase [Neobacillus mesonae]|uniref:2-amino-4-hydroxy-6-hydroxymethyldihydropteridine diphosphokinase n=1 Tax=Neobacillus mesonae TaxID=1193713 RepID=A0A3Q9QVT1_9BACI|nr:2-amino-4-hydroxy-6-hydroxymethyldihydropteridine diphosphokinase [Neobacillus mesonae]AZU59874.1 2-amino-4-hydroxy-6-hydroxymethyldihydropteridine diphosphokinase [Neobacillus mesonae]
MENTAIIALGSNIGDRYQTMMQAIEKLTAAADVKLVNTSSVYETDPVGYEDQDVFLNMVIEVKMDLDAFALLDRCLNIELELGRKREIKWGPRTIDLDILTYNQENINHAKLVVPHPRMLERAFVLVPLIEMKPEIKVLGTDKPISASLDELPDREGVRLWKRKNGEDGYEHIES